MTIPRRREIVGTAKILPNGPVSTARQRVRLFFGQLGAIWPRSVRPTGRVRLGLGTATLADARGTRHRRRRSGKMRVDHAARPHRIVGQVQSDGPS